MCLEFKRRPRRLTAKEDIICYKRVEEDAIINYPYEELNGKPFTGIIKHLKVDGVINTNEGHVYFCTNFVSLDGNACKEKYGYKYSWLFDSKVKEIIFNDKNIVGHGYRTPYRLFPIKIGNTYTSDLILEKTFGNTVEVGLHSFVRASSAFNDGDGVVVKCVIPKGSKYFEGTFDRQPAFASNCIIYLELIEEIN